jgi:hypothetical protein
MMQIFKLYSHLMRRYILMFYFAIKFPIKLTRLYSIIELCCDVDNVPCPGIPEIGLFLPL